MRLQLAHVPLPMEATVIGNVEDTAIVFCWPRPLGSVAMPVTLSMTYAVLPPWSQSLVVLAPVMFIGYPRMGSSWTTAAAPRSWRGRVQRA